MKDKPRLEFLDALRGIAALAVFFEHACGPLFSQIKAVQTYGFQIGQFGVSLFSSAADL